MRLRVICLLPLLVFALFAQAQWNKVSLGTSADLMDIHFTAHGHGYIVGLSNTIYKTTDSGANWVKLNTTSFAHMVGVHFTDTLQGFTFGNNALVQRTVNGGKTWTSNLFITGRYLHKADFLDAAHGIAVGEAGLVVSTKDSGKTWQTDTVKMRKDFNHVDISPGGRCWAVGDSGFIFTKQIDTGAWTRVTSYSTNIRLAHVKAFDDTTVLISGGMLDTLAGKFVNILLYSVNGGKSWEYNTADAARQINSAYYFNPDTGYVAGSSGIIAKVYQRGVKSGRQTTSTVNGLNDIEFVSHTKGFAIGDGGTILKTDNKGGYGTGVRNSAVPKSPSVFPNPASVYESATVTAPYKIKEVQLFDMQGRQVSFRNVVSGNTCSIQVSAPGVYTLLVKGTDGSQSHSRFIVR